MKPSRLRLAVLISGSGRNLQAMIDAVGAGTLAADLVGVIANRADAYGLERAKRAGIPVQVIPHTAFAAREAFDAALGTALDALAVDVVALAGFMRILGAPLVERFQGRMLNIHPSLLPLYPGLHTHQRALDAGDAQSGATVHYVTPTLDAGPAILQGSVAIHPGDTAASLAERVMSEVEQHIYVEVLRWCADGRLRLHNGNVWLDGRERGAPLRWPALH